MSRNEQERERLWNDAKSCEQSNLSFKSKRREMEKIKRHHDRAASGQAPETMGDVAGALLDKKIKF